MGSFPSAGLGYPAPRFRRFCPLAGWYDAGDYNKYMVNSGITMGTMLSAFEDFQPFYEKLPLNIPENVKRFA